MEQTDADLSSNLYKYAIGWFCFAFIMFLIRMAVQFFYPGVNGLNRLIVALVFLIAMGIFVNVISSREFDRLSSYMLKKHGQILIYEKYQISKFVSSKENFGDPHVDKLKSDYRNMTYFQWVVFLSFPVCMLS